MRKHGLYMSPFGPISFTLEDGKLIHMSFSDDGHSVIDDQDTKMVVKSLEQYFSGSSSVFGLPVFFNQGTAFQQSVWHALMTIPGGETKSYAEIAALIGHDKAYRAVGQACRNNPVGLVIPCHRVIGKDGSMTGYSGKNYVGLKRQLLDFEQQYYRSRSH